MLIEFYYKAGVCANENIKLGGVGGPGADTPSILEFLGRLDTLESDN